MSGHRRRSAVRAAAATACLVLAAACAPTQSPEPTTPDRPAVVNRQVAADIASISGTSFVSEPLDVTDLERLTAVTAPSVGGCVVTSLDLLGPPGAVDAPISSWVPSSGGAPRLEVDSLPPTVRVRIGVDSTPCQVPWTVWGQR